MVKVVRCEHAKVDMSQLINVGAFDLARVLEEQYMEEDEFMQMYEPKMDSSIANVGIRCEGIISMPALQNFVGKYLDDPDVAKDFMRIKGLFNIGGKDKVFVMQCVHMMRHQNYTREWGKDEARENRIIFIGRGMQKRRQELTDGFMGCVVGAKPLRFPVGSKAMANVGHIMGYGMDMYFPCTIVKHWDDYKAYRIRMASDGDEGWANIDDDKFIKAADS